MGVFSFRGFSMKGIAEKQRLKMYESIIGVMKVTWDITQVGPKMEKNKRMNRIGESLFHSPLPI